MKQEIANWFLIIGYALLSVSILIKFILWIRLRSPRRIGFLKSFAVWFSKNDIHDASSNRSRTFLYWNNVLTIVIWFSTMILLIGFVLDTDTVETLADPRMRKL